MKINKIKYKVKMLTKYKIQIQNLNHTKTSLREIKKVDFRTARFH